MFGALRVNLSKISTFRMAALGVLSLAPLICQSLALLVFLYSSEFHCRFTNGCFYCRPMGVDYVVIGFDMEVQPLVTRNAA